MVIHIQSVLFSNRPSDLWATLEAANQSSLVALQDEHVVHFSYGDSSPEPLLDETWLNDARKTFRNLRTISYHFFDANLGSAGGQNRLAQTTDADALFLINPDVRLTPDCIRLLARALSQDGVGIVEARQMPIEHAKYYEQNSLDTSWTSGACSLISRNLFESIGGYDSETFFLYCDDVDLAWRVRLEGMRALHCPSAAVYHAKRLSASGQWQPSEAEKLYSAEAELLMAYKWSFDTVVEQRLKDWRASNLPHLKEAVRLYEKRQSEGRLPKQIDPEHKVGDLQDGAYGPMRFKLS